MSRNTTIEQSTLEIDTADLPPTLPSSPIMPPTLPCSPVAHGTPTVIMGTPSARLEESTLSPTLSLGSAETSTVLLGTPTERLDDTTVIHSAVAAPPASASTGFRRVFFGRELFFQLATALTAIWMVDQDSLDLGTVLVVCRETWAMRSEMRRAIQHTVAHDMRRFFRAGNIPTALQWLQIWRTYPQVPVLLPNGVDNAAFDPPQEPRSNERITTRNLSNLIILFTVMNGVLNNLIRRGVFSRSENREAALEVLNLMRVHLPTMRSDVRRQLADSLKYLLRSSFALEDVSDIPCILNKWLPANDDFAVVLTGVQLTVSDSDIERCNASLPERQRLKIQRGPG